MTIRDKILIIEDEPTIANFMRAILEARDYEVMIVQSGAMASTLIASHCPDLIILDLGLPDMDGMQILKSVRSWSKVPVVVVSARRSHARTSQPCSFATPSITAVLLSTWMAAPMRLSSPV